MVAEGNRGSRRSDQRPMSRAGYETRLTDLEHGLECFADAREALQVDVLELLAHEDPELRWDA